MSAGAHRYTYAVTFRFYAGSIPMAGGFDYDSDHLLSAPEDMPALLEEIERRNILSEADTEAMVVLPALYMIDGIYIQDAPGQGGLQG